ncbi:hypothetical protein THAOC_14445, partial [Thalassiosira oceanica]
MVPLYSLSPFYLVPLRPPLSLERTSPPAKETRRPKSISHDRSIDRAKSRAEEVRERRTKVRGSPPRRKASRVAEREFARQTGGGKRSIRKVPARFSGKSDRGSPRVPERGRKERRREGRRRYAAREEVHPQAPSPPEGRLLLRRAGVGAPGQGEGGGRRARRRGGRDSRGSRRGHRRRAPDRLPALDARPGRRRGRGGEGGGRLPRLADGGVPEGGVAAEGCRRGGSGAGGGAGLEALRAAVAEEASMDSMRAYIDCLGDDVSPDTGGDLPSRALRCLFALSESSGSRAERLAMVGGEFGPLGEGTGGTRALVPALLSFLGRCPRDSSEQYLTLLVLNNLSIPAANKRAIAIGHGGAASLGRLLCRDPGCHLLVIILVNLTFGDRSLNLDLVRRREGGKGEEREAGPLDFLMRSLSGGEGEADGANAGEEFEDPQLIECICYALLVSFCPFVRPLSYGGGGIRCPLEPPPPVSETKSLTTRIGSPPANENEQLSSLTSDQLEKLGPIPLEDGDGSARRPADLLASLT